MQDIGGSPEAPGSARRVLGSPPMPSPTQVRGAEAERLAERSLATAGYRIVERNWRGGGGEIDRIAWHGAVLVFVEIRARASEVFGDPAETVRAPKQRKLVQAACAYAVRLEPMPALRFDVVSVLIARDQPPRVQIIADAFDADPTGRSRHIPLL